MLPVLLLAASVALCSGDCVNMPPLELTDVEMADLIAKMLKASEPFTLNTDELKLSTETSPSKLFLSAATDSDKIKKHGASNLFPYLLNNYVPEEGKGHDEKEPRGEKRENKWFWHYVCTSTIIAPLKKALSDKGIWHKTSKSDKNGDKDFCKQLRFIWMDYFSRSKGAATDSNGMEHTFIGDVRGTKIGGLHYWRELYELERMGRISEVSRKGCKPDSDCVATLTFKWDVRGDGSLIALKKTGSMFMGEPPEVLIGLGTLCMLARRGQDCVFDYNVAGRPSCKVKGRAYPYYEYKGDRCYVSSFFPMFDSC